MLLHLQTPRTRRLRFLAGQYVTLQAGEIPPVDYPVASCRATTATCNSTFSAYRATPFADHVFNGLKSGDTVNILGPRGEFVLREDSPRNLVFIALDTGFAPIKSLIEHAMALDVAESLHLYWLATEGRSHYFSNQCAPGTNALDNFHFTPIELPSAAATDAGFTAELLRVAHDIRNCATAMCMSPAPRHCSTRPASSCLRGPAAEQLVLGYRADRPVWPLYPIRSSVRSGNPRLGALLSLRQLGINCRTCDLSRLLIRYGASGMNASGFYCVCSLCSAAALRSGAGRCAGGSRDPAGSVAMDIPAEMYRRSHRSPSICRIRSNVR